MKEYVYNVRVYCSYLWSGLL